MVRGLGARGPRGGTGRRRRRPRRARPRVVRRVPGGAGRRAAVVRGVAAGDGRALPRCRRRRSTSRTSPPRASRRSSRARRLAWRRASTSGRRSSGASPNWWPTMPPGGRGRPAGPPSLVECLTAADGRGVVRVGRLDHRSGLEVAVACYEHLEAPWSATGLAADVSFEAAAMRALQRAVVTRAVLAHEDPVVAPVGAPRTMADHVRGTGADPSCGRSTIGGCGLTPRRCRGSGRTTWGEAMRSVGDLAAVDVTTGDVARCGRRVVRVVAPGLAPLAVDDAGADASGAPHPSAERHGRHPGERPRRAPAARGGGAPGRGPAPGTRGPAAGRPRGPGGRVLRAGRPAHARAADGDPGAARRGVA